MLVRTIERVVRGMGKTMTKEITRTLVVALERVKISKNTH
jgi:hypothetical protein